MAKKLYGERKCQWCEAKVPISEATLVSVRGKAKYRCSHCLHRVEVGNTFFSSYASISDLHNLDDYYEVEKVGCMIRAKEFNKFRLDKEWFAI